MSGRKTAVLLGDGRMAQEALGALEADSFIDLAAVIHHGESSRGFRRLRSVDVSRPEKLLECANVNDPGVLAHIAALGPDIIFNVNNFDIIRADLLNIPDDGILNFHNGPLPRYRGVNAPSWAIFNGEQHHAVTWHFVDEGVDTGPVLRESAFRLADDETAISLIFRCIDEGIRVLPEILEGYAAGELAATPQDGDGRFYSAKDAPNGGRIDCTRSCAEVDRLVRSLTFHPFENNFVHPHLMTPAGAVRVGKVSILPAGETGAVAEAGEVIDCAGDKVVVRCKDGSVALEYLADEQGRAIDTERMTAEFGLQPGARI